MNLKSSVLKTVSLVITTGLLLAIASIPDLASGAAAPAARHREAPPSISVGLFVKETSNRLMRVPQFQFIRERAQKMGVRAWLFGGTAAGFAHYVKWDLLREAGDTRFQPDRFDYDYTNIYRSTQDLDVVIDGNEQQAADLERELSSNFPAFKGSKNNWELRLLTKSRGEKEALLNNPDFLNQHTDSNSTGMIEVTVPPRGEEFIRDLRDWRSQDSWFLKDILSGQLHYYFSDLHGETSRAKNGLNPPILSVIRYLTKAFQYELEMRTADLEKIRKIIADFSPTDVRGNRYVTYWIKKNGKKLIQNAVNIEYAWNTLEELGLRSKLMELDDETKKDSLAWWMNKEPLRTFPVGKADGETAEKLGIDVVAHETSGFLAYESITRAHTGEPNVLISRQGVEGENAACGNGFYTRRGRQGARGTRFTIRFKVNPRARAGSDFIVEGSDFVIVLNKAVLQVIPEQMHLDVLSYFKALASEEGISDDDQGILEKLRRRIELNLNTLSEIEGKEIFDFIDAYINQFSEKSKVVVLSEWFRLPLSKKRPEFFEKVIGKGAILEDLMEGGALGKTDWVFQPGILTQIKKQVNKTLEVDPHKRFLGPFVNDFLSRTEKFQTHEGRKIFDEFYDWIVGPEKNTNSRWNLFHNIIHVDFFNSDSALLKKIVPVMVRSSDKTALVDLVSRTRREGGAYVESDEFASFLLEQLQKSGRRELELLSLKLFEKGEHPGLGPQLEKVIRSAMSRHDEALLAEFFKLDFGFFSRTNQKLFKPDLIMDVLKFAAKNDMKKIFSSFLGGFSDSKQPSRIPLIVEAGKLVLAMGDDSLILELISSLGSWVEPEIRQFFIPGIKRMKSSRWIRNLITSNSFDGEEWLALCEKVRSFKDSKALLTTLIDSMHQIPHGFRSEAIEMILRTAQELDDKAVNEALVDFFAQTSKPHDKEFLERFLEGFLKRRKDLPYVVFKKIQDIFNDGDIRDTPSLKLFLKWAFKRNDGYPSRAIDFITDDNGFWIRQKEISQTLEQAIAEGNEKLLNAVMTCVHVTYSVSREPEQKIMVEAIWNGLSRRPDRDKVLIEYASYIQHIDFQTKPAKALLEATRKAIEKKSCKALLKL